jgi:hypothetical protein
MVIICLSGDQWKKLEPHLPEEGVCTKLTDDAGAFPMLDCREIPDETTYQKVLGIAKTHCKKSRSTNASATRTNSRGDQLCFSLCR